MSQYQGQQQVQGYNHYGNGTQNTYGQVYQKPTPGICEGDLLEPIGTSTVHEQNMRNVQKMSDFYHNDLQTASQYQTNQVQQYPNQFVKGAKTFFQNLDGMYHHQSNYQQQFSGQDQTIASVEKDLEKTKQLQNGNTPVIPEEDDTLDEHSNANDQIGRRLRKKQFVYNSPQIQVKPQVQIQGQQQIQVQGQQYNPQITNTKQQIQSPLFLDSEMKRLGETFSVFCEHAIILTWYSRLEDLERMTADPTLRGESVCLDNQKDREAFARWWIKTKCANESEAGVKCLIKDLIYVFQSGTIMQTHNSFDSDLEADCSLFLESESIHGESKKMVIPRSQEFSPYELSLNSKIAAGWDANKMDDKIAIAVKYNDHTCTDPIHREHVSPNGRKHYSLRPTHPIYMMFASKAFFKDGDKKNDNFKQGRDGKFPNVTMVTEDYPELDQMCRGEIKKLPFSNNPVVRLRTPEPNILKKELICNVPYIMKTKKENSRENEVNDRVYKAAYERPGKVQIRLKVVFKYIVPHEPKYYDSIRG